jgi:N6-L-threonylcarbamoyladenine synthase
MKILGIDTILHDVCIAILENGQILSNEIIHKPFPLVKDSLLDLTAEHVGETSQVLDKVFKKARISISDISLIAVNNSGSLFSNVMIGLITANTLSQIQNIPLVDVEHQEGHIFSNWIERDVNEFNFPVLVFSASGGHTLIAFITKDNFKFKVLSEVKGIKKGLKNKPGFVGLGALFSELVHYLGLQKSKQRIKGDGQFISDLAKKGNSQRFNFYSQSKVKKQDLDFVDLRNSVIDMVKKRKGKLSLRFISDLAASFENSLAEIVTSYLCFLAQKKRVKEIHLVGGVSANRVLQKKLIQKTRSLNLIGRYPSKEIYCIDNAVMIANLGYLKFKRDPGKYLKQRYLNIKSDLILEDLAVKQFLEQNKELK